MVTASQTLFYCDTAGCDIACVPSISKLFSHGVNKHPLLPGLFLLRHSQPLVKLQPQGQDQVAVRGGGWGQLQWGCVQQQQPTIWRSGGGGKCHLNRSSVARGEHVKGDVSSQALQGRTTCQPVAQFCEGNGPSHILKHKPQDYLCRWPWVTYCKIYSYDVSIIYFPKNSYHIHRYTLYLVVNTKIWIKFSVCYDQMKNYVQFIVYYSINSRKWKNHIKIETLIIWKIALVCTKKQA